MQAFESMEVKLRVFNCYHVGLLEDLLSRSKLRFYIW